MIPTKNRILVYALTVLCAANLCFIFANSIPSIPESRKTSEQVLEIVKPILEEIVGEENATNHFVRKCAHVAEFFCFGALLTTLFLLTDRNILWSCQIGLLVALIDETIQLFSSRGAQISDVWLDFASVIASVIIIRTIIGLHGCCKRKHSKEKSHENENQ